jgi:hypothetical protein
MKALCVMEGPNRHSLLRLCMADREDDLLIYVSTFTDGQQGVILQPASWAQKYKTAREKLFLLQNWKHKSVNINNKSNVLHPLSLRVRKNGLHFEVRKYARYVKMSVLRTTVLGT